MKKNNILKITSCSLLVLLIFLISGCSLIQQYRSSLINEIRNEYVEYEQNITVSDIEEALVVASDVAKSASIGVLVKSKSFMSGDVSGSAVILKRVENNNKTYTYTAVTNRHVSGVKSSSERYVYLGVDSNGKSIYVDAELVVYDSTYDLALLKFTTGLLLNVVTINTEEPKVGSFAIAVGSPYNLEGFFNTVTVGSVSAVNRVYQDEDVNGNTVKNNFLQHDASINSGNSGGGLFDIYGRLIGINTWKIASNLSDDYVGLNFAIPVKEVVERFKDYL